MSIEDYAPDVTITRVPKSGDDTYYMKLSLLIDGDYLHITQIRVMPTKKPELNEPYFVAWPGFMGNRSYIEFSRYSTLKSRLERLCLQAKADYEANQPPDDWEG
jgi:hypothetical protein